MLSYRTNRIKIQISKPQKEFRAEFGGHDVAPVGGGVGTGMQIRVADLNADGRPDIAVSGKTGTWVLLNEGAK